LGDLKDLLAEVTHGRGVDLALELCGAPEAFEEGLALLRTGGKYLLVGAVFPTRPAEVSAEIVVRKLLTIQGVHNYVPEDLATAVQFLADVQSEYPLANLVREKFPLAAAESAFEHARTSGAFRVAVVPEKY
jgi:alcohol dehydrogenase